MVIIGLGGLTKDIMHDLLKQYDADELLFFSELENDSNMEYFSKNGLKVSANQQDILDHFENKDKRFIVSVGHNNIRQQLVTKYQSLGGTPYFLISDTAHVEIDLCNISKVNTIIMNCAMISAGANIEDGVIISQYAYAGHDATIGKYSFMAGYSCISNGTVGEYSFIGLKTVILPGRSVGKNALVGAYSMVNKSIPDDVKAFGIPAKVTSK